MNNFFVLPFIDDNEDGNIIKGTTFDAKMEKLEDLFDDGVSLVNKIFPPFSVIIDDRNSTTNKLSKDRIYFRSNAGTLLTVSQRAKDVLEGLGLALEFFPISMKGKKISLEDYFIVNVLNKIKCVDQEKSDLDYNSVTGGIDFYDRLVLEERKIPLGLDILLLGECITQLIIVSRRVKEAIEDAGLTGFNLVKPEDYRNF